MKTNCLNCKELFEKKSHKSRFCCRNCLNNYYYHTVIKLKRKPISSELRLSIKGQKILNSIYDIFHQREIIYPSDFNKMIEIINFLKSSQRISHKNDTDENLITQIYNVWPEARSFAISYLNKNGIDYENNKMDFIIYYNKLKKVDIIK